jgi:hypothetical protein
MVKLLRVCVGMPWRKKAMKDVVSCDKPRGGANIRYIRGFPNGEIRSVCTLIILF